LIEIGNKKLLNTPSKALFNGVKQYSCKFLKLKLLTQDLPEHHVV
jgi:hypothetical protein